jgi:hypothetical protein
MEDFDVTPAPGSPDVLEAASDELERAESSDDEARLATLDSVHARLSSELDKPAGESSPS